MQSGCTRDASWLIGPLLILPALAYLSYWSFHNSDYLRRAETATATVTEIEERVERRGRRGRVSGRRGYVTWLTHVQFENKAGQPMVGTLLGKPYEAEVGAQVPIYYDPQQPDIRLAGPRGIHFGLYIALAALVLGPLLGIVAWVTTHPRSR